MNIFKKIFFPVREFFFPGACALCAGSLTAPNEMRFSLCEKCQNSLAESKRLDEQGGKCGICGKPLVSEIETCLPCRNSEGRSFDRLWTIFPYIGKYRKLLTAYKLEKNTALANFFAQKIIELFKEIPNLDKAVIVPVPPRPGKIKDTGWDQVDYIFKRLKGLPGCPPICRCLKRKKSKIQKNLTRAERLENLKGRIYLNPSAAKEYIEANRIFIIIDDVITTGSTIEVCSAVLKQGGIQNIYGICLFYD